MLSTERSQLKKHATAPWITSCDHPTVTLLEHELMQCRLLARKFALGKHKDVSVELESSLNHLKDRTEAASDREIKRTALLFRNNILIQMSNANTDNRRGEILKACDILR
jgi:hypothetical protein